MQPFYAPVSCSSGVALANKGDSVTPSPECSCSLPEIRGNLKKSIVSVPVGESAASRRWMRQHVLRAVTESKTLRQCRTTPINPEVEVRAGDGGAYLGGLMKCASVWSCPCCAASISVQRAQELRDISVECLRSGGTVLMGLFTVPHGKKDHLSETWDAVSKSWTAVWNGRHREKAAGKWGAVGAVRALEITHGRHGWHPHIHYLVFSDRVLSDAEIDDFRAWLFARWSSVVVKRGWFSPDSRGQGLERAVSAEKASEYLVKAEAYGAALETVSGQLKHSQSDSGRAPFQILDSIRLYCRSQDLVLWREYESASKGRRQLTWVNGKRVKERWSPDAPELSDEDAVESMEEEKGALLAKVAPPLWKAVLKLRAEYSVIALAGSRDSQPRKWGAFLDLCDIASRDGPLSDYGLETESWETALEMVLEM